MQQYQDLFEWDPLSEASSDQAELLNEARRLQIRNIVRSYTGFYDVLSELIQNGLDSVDQRESEASKSSNDYQPALWLHVNIQDQCISLTDNGMGLSRDQLRLFLQPNLTFKRKADTRGHKGVGATFLAYGYNYLQVATRVPGFTYIGTLESGREWVEDTDYARPKPHIKAVGTADHDAFVIVDRGASITIKLYGNDTRPKDLGWIGATTADQWAAVLRIKTPLGGIYLFDEQRPKTVCYLKVTDRNGEITEAKISSCEYYYPTEISGRKATLREIIQAGIRAGEAGKLGRLPSEVSQLNCIYDVFSSEDILAGRSEIKPSFDVTNEDDEHQMDLMKRYRPDVAVYFVNSVNFWNAFNDQTLGLRVNHRILRGGLQIATQGMIQGELQGIPLTFATGYENTTLVIVHFHGAEPDLGRKGFQPDLVQLAQKLAVAAVNTFKRYYAYLRKDIGPSRNQVAAERYQWIAQQEAYAREHPLAVTGSALFAPEERVPIISEPLVEQDVVALFNQLLAAGVIRGFEVLATSGYERYDGVVRIHIEPSEKFVYDIERNPLGVPREDIRAFTSEPKILEFKYDFDSLIEDFSREVKFEQHVDLVVVWQLGTHWKERYSIIPLLHHSYTRHRTFHGITHKVLNAITGSEVFDAIVLQDLILYLKDPNGDQRRIREKYLDNLA